MITREMARHNLELLAEHKAADLHVGAGDRLEVGRGPEQAVREVVSQLIDLERRQYKWYGKREIGQVRTKSAKRPHTLDIFNKT